MLLVYNHALQTPAEKKKNNEKRETFSQSIDSPLFFDDELPKPSLVGSAVVGCDGSVTGTLFFEMELSIYLCDLINWKKTIQTFVSMLVKDMLSGDVCIR